jgi:isopenicillin N synthase-like dioxygenase
MDGIPLIDVSGLRSPELSARSAIAVEIGRACREVGFFAVTGHGVPQATMEGLFVAARRFFEQPTSAKEALAATASGGNRGYVGVGVEQLDGETGDVKEAFDIALAFPATKECTNGVASSTGMPWPQLEGWRERACEYFDAVHDVGLLLHRAFALDLGLPVRRLCLRVSFTTPKSLLNIDHTSPALPLRRTSSATLWTRRLCCDYCATRPPLLLLLLSRAALEQRLEQRQHMLLRLASTRTTTT